MKIQIKHMAKIPLPNDKSIKAIIMSMFCYETKSGDIFQNYEYRSSPTGTGDLYVPPNMEKLKVVSEMLGLPIEDLRSTGEPLSEAFTLNPEFNFRPHQTEPCAKLVNHMQKGNHAVAVGGCGVGKSAIGAYVAGNLGCKVLILVDMSSLAAQWADAFQLVWNKPVQQIKAGDTEFGDVCCATFQLLNRNPALLAKIRTEFGVAIFDEMHTCKATTFKQVLFRLDNRYRLGLTATFMLKNAPVDVLEDLIAPVTLTVKDQNALKAQVKFIDTGVKFASDDPNVFGNKTVPALAANSERNMLIAQEVMQAVYEGRAVAVITMTVVQAKMLEGAIRSMGGKPVMYTGTTSTKKDKEVKDGITDGTYNVLLTSRKLDKGFDLPRLDTVAMTRPLNNKTAVQQITGRIVRPYEGKAEPMVLDFVDEGSMGLAATFKRNRERWYKELGYKILL